MDIRLLHLIHDYQAVVLKCIELLEASGISRPNSSIEWAANGINYTGILADGSKYYKHGIGCAIHSINFKIDFDFRENGEIDGFTFNRLEGFAEGELHKYGIESNAELKNLINSACFNGDLKFSGNILWYVRKD
jgi:hypothetical protein